MNNIYFAAFMEEFLEDIDPKKGVAPVERLQIAHSKVGTANTKPRNKARNKMERMYIQATDIRDKRAERTGKDFFKASDFSRY